MRGMERIVRGGGVLLAVLLLPAATTPRAAEASNAAATGPRKEELRVTSRDGVSLAGTLYLPAGPAPYPAVVFTHGSEPGRRTMSGYIEWARFMQERGLAGLVFDKRGVGDSGGTYVEAPDLEVPADDLLAWVDLLSHRTDIRPEAIGVLGWSQGGWVGPLAASRSREIAFVVAISGPGVSPLEQNIFDKTNQLRASGATDEQVEIFSRTISRVWTYLATGASREEAFAAWNAVKNEAWFRSAYSGPPMMDREAILSDPRMKDYVAHSTYDPVPAFEKLRVPYLALFGGADTVVPVTKSLEAMKAAFDRSGNTKFEFKIYPGADHGLRVHGPEGTLVRAPRVMDDIADWILKGVPRNGARKPRQSRR